MKKEKVTIEDLAAMVQKGFNEVTSQMARKNEMNRRFNEVGERFDNIEKLILADHRHRIEKLEVEVKNLKELLAIK